MLSNVADRNLENQQKYNRTESVARTVSAHAPTVTVVSPNGGETWPTSSIQTIVWNGSDLDGDSLTYNVLYSANGSTWVPVGTGITATQLAVNTAELAGGTAARVRVVATDGINTSRDESDATFTVGRKGPSAFILAPEADARFMPDTPLWLQGYAYDLEDGTFPDSAYRWTSNRDGDLGTGASNLVTLSSGPHVITLMVTDSDGNTAIKTIRLSAGNRLFLPAVLRGL